MSELELLIALIAIAVVMVRVADLVAIPYPIVLVVAGLGIGLVPGAPGGHLEPEVVFLVFLPPLLHEAGYAKSPRELAGELGPLTWLVVGLSLTTMVAVAAAAQAIIPWLGWGEALLLGAIVAPTDPVSAVATFSRVGVPARISLLVEGESLLNDATALTAYRVALAAVVTGVFSVGGALVDLAVGVVGGVAIGLAIGWLAVHMQRRLDDPPLATLLSIVIAYASYLTAEHVGASGVLAVVASGLYVGWYAHEMFDVDTRLSSLAFWRTFVFALNVILFILLGLQFPDIVETVSEELSVAEMIGYGALISGVVIAVRITWQFIPALLGRAFPAALALDTGESWRERLVVGWAGMRGAVSLAAALSLPIMLDDGSRFAGREELIYLTVAVIIVTLVFQGLTLPGLVRLLGVNEERAWDEEEGRARLELAEAALRRLDEIEESRDDLPDELLERFRDAFDARLKRARAASEGSSAPRPLVDSVRAGRELRAELIEAEREVLQEHKRNGSVNADVLQMLERELDLEEARFLSR